MAIKPLPYQFSLRLAAVTAMAFIVGACGLHEQAIPPASMHDIKLLASYGSATRGGTLATTERKASLEREIQSRRLLDAQDVMVVQEKMFRGGASMAATMAIARYIPKAHGTSLRHAGVEVLIYEPDWHMVKEDHEFFFQNGRLSGWRYTAPDPNTGAPIRSNMGRTFSLSDFQIIPCQKLGDSPCSGLRVPRAKTQRG